MNAVNHDDLNSTLRDRFTSNMHRHPDLSWEDIQARLAAKPAILRTLAEMERTGGEPDVVLLDGVIAFVDCSPESPTGRRSLCFDQKALDGRKENKPVGAAQEAAALMEAGLLTEAQYRALQALEPFDRKTSSWIATPDAIRALGGALFCDRRYNMVFTYHNGAESYYAARGFRCRLVI
jgi:Protein of unknown function (DUF4256)